MSFSAYKSKRFPSDSKLNGTLPSPGEYQPSIENEWINRISRKPTSKLGVCITKGERLPIIISSQKETPSPGTYELPSTVTAKLNLIQRERMAHDMQDQAYNMYMTAKAAKVEPNPKTKKKMEAAISNLPSVYCEPRVRRRIAHLCKYFGNPN